MTSELYFLKLAASPLIAGPVGRVRTGGGAQVAEDVEEQAAVPPTRVSLQSADFGLPRFAAIYHTCAGLPLPAGP
jgi:hypothetical protein